MPEFLKKACILLFAFSGCFGLMHDNRSRVEAGHEWQRFRPATQELLHRIFRRLHNGIRLHAARKHPGTDLRRIAKQADADRGSLSQFILENTKSFGERVDLKIHGTGVVRGAHAVPVIGDQQNRSTQAQSGQRECLCGRFD